MNQNRLISLKDLDFILKRLEPQFPINAFSGENILLTGATGFFGKWLTQSLLGMEGRWNLGNKITILTRDRDRALRESPWLKGRKQINWIEGDIRKFKTSAAFTTIIHGAAQISDDAHENQPEIIFDTIVEGTKRILELTDHSSFRRLQLISSGAVYDTQPWDLEGLPETFERKSETPNTISVYGEAKRVAELLCTTTARRHGFHLSIPRCFAFIGPYLPLEKHFAAGNFINDVLNRKSLSVSGDGSAVRSYLYAADLMVWLFTLLFRSPSSKPFNVGSNIAVSVEELASVVHREGCEILVERKKMINPISISKIRDPKTNPKRYVPNVDRARNELGLETWTNLSEAVSKTLSWYLE